MLEAAGKHPLPGLVLQAKDARHLEWAFPEIRALPIAP